MISTDDNPYPPAPGTGKVSLAAAAWGLVVWLLMATVLAVVAGFFVSVLWNNVAHDLNAPELTFVGGVNVVVLVMVLSRVATSLRVLK